MLHPSLAEFEVLLEETARWCLAHASPAAPATSLRVTSLHPGVDAGKIAQNVTQALVDAIAVERRRQVQALPAAEIRSVREGRLLVYDPDGNLADGAAAIESEGFLDDDNAPPAATWVCRVEETTGAGQWRSFHSYLLAWIPAPFVALVDSGIEVNPEECILWASDPKLRGLGFIERLRAAGWLA